MRNRKVYNAKCLRETEERMKESVTRHMTTILRNSSYPTFTNKVICGDGESYPTMVGLLDIIRAALYGMKRATERTGGPRTCCDFGRVFLTPPSSPHVGTARQHSQVVKLLAS